MGSNKDELPMAVAADHLTVRYRNGALGVTDVSLRVGLGQVVVLLGANGAGKTTTVRAISGFLKTEKARIIRGSVRLFGEDTTNLEPHRTMRLGVAFVPERRKIFRNLTVAENLSALGTLPPRDRRPSVYDQVFEWFPALAERRSVFAGRLSGGQQQMLALARAVVAEPKLMIIDEMTLGLHHSLFRPLFATVKKIALTGTAVLIVDEGTEYAREIADECHVISDGRLSHDSPATDIGTTTCDSSVTSSRAVHP